MNLIKLTLVTDPEGAALPTPTVYLFNSADIKYVRPYSTGALVSFYTKRFHDVRSLEDPEQIWNQQRGEAPA